MHAKQKGERQENRTVTIGVFTNYPYEKEKKKSSKGLSSIFRHPCIVSEILVYFLAGEDNSQ